MDWKARGQPCRGRLHHSRGCRERFDRGLYALENKNDLGVHADMLTDAYLHLVKMAVITNKRKTLSSGEDNYQLLLGSRELYEFVDKQPHGGLLSH